MVDMFSIFGIGQCGCRIASEFYKVGIKAYYINSDAIDMRGLDVSDSDKLMLDTTGSGGSPTKGRAILEKNYAKFVDFMKSRLDSKRLNLFVLGLGGGTGGGMIVPAINYAIENGFKVGVIATLPSKVLGMLAIDNAMRILKSLKTLNLSMFILADNEYLTGKVGTSSVWWQKINYYILSKVAAAFDILRDGKISQSGIGSIDKAEVIRILQYGGGLVDIRDTYFTVDEIGLEEADIKKKIFSPSLVEGYNYRDTLAYLVSIDVPKKGGYTEFASKIFNVAKSTCGSAISRIGMFSDPMLSEKDAVRVTMINSGLKLPKVLQKRINNLKKDSDKHEEKKNKEDSLDFGQLDTIRNIEENFDIL